MSLVSLNVIIPLFLSIGYGYFLKKIHILNEDILYKLNGIIFHAFFPLLMFKNIYRTNIQSVFQPKLILYAIIMLITIIIVLLVAIPFYYNSFSTYCIGGHFSIFFFS